MGSKALERGGHRVIAYDARGHGASSPAPGPDAYGYEVLAADLGAVLDDRGVERARARRRLDGRPHGRALRARPRRPRRPASSLVTPAFDPDDRRTRRASRAGTRWPRACARRRRRVRRGLRRPEGSPEQWRDTIGAVLRQRLAAHEHPARVADALRAVPRSRPFESWDELAELDASRRSSSPAATRPTRAPYAIGERYAEAIPGAGWCPRSRARRRWPGRAASSRR